MKRTVLRSKTLYGLKSEKGENGADTGSSNRGNRGGERDVSF